MSTTVGNGLTVDGTVKASQATQAGEAVVLGDDGMIPASLLPNTGGETWERIAYNSTLVIGDVYKIRCPFGEVTFVHNINRKDDSTIIYFPTVVSNNSNTTDYRLVSISSNKISNFQFGYRYAGEATKYSFYASDTTCRLYHLVE